MSLYCCCCCWVVPLGTKGFEVVDIDLVDWDDAAGLAEYWTNVFVDGDDGEVETISLTGAIVGLKDVRPLEVLEWWYLYNKIDSHYAIFIRQYIIIIFFHGSAYMEKARNKNIKHCKSTRIHSSGWFASSSIPQKCYANGAPFSKSYYTHFHLHQLLKLHFLVISIYIPRARRDLLLNIATSNYKLCSVLCVSWIYFNIYLYTMLNRGVKSTFSKCNL